MSKQRELALAKRLRLLSTAVDEWGEHTERGAQMMCTNDAWGLASIATNFRECLLKCSE